MSRRIAFEPRQRFEPPPDPLADLPQFVVRVDPASGDLVAAYTAAKARAQASWANYGAWVNGSREPHPVLPEGPDEKRIPGLELALRIVAARHAGHPDYRAEWKP